MDIPIRKKISASMNKVPSTNGTVSKDKTVSIVSIPTEILTNICCMADLQSVYNTADYLDGHFSNTELSEDIIDRVTNISTYLANFLPGGADLLDCMLVNDAVVCGSVAVNFFQRGSFTKDSDVDIIVPGHRDKLNNTMQFLANHGVVWKTRLEHFIEKLNDTSKIQPIGRSEALDLREMCKSRPVNPVAITAIDLLCTRILGPRSLDELGYFHIQVDNIKNTKTTFVYKPSGYDLFEIINGKYKQKDASLNIQLIVVRGYSLDCVLSSILSFHSTIVQCGISGIGAFHLYADDVYSMEGCIWPCSRAAQDKKNPDNIDECINKYVSRGYKFTYSRDRYIPKSRSRNTNTHRCVDDAFADVVLYDRYSDPNFIGPSNPRIRDLQELKTDYFLGYSWTHSAMGIEYKSKRIDSYENEKGVLRRCTEAIEQHMNKVPRSVYTTVRNAIINSAHKNAFEIEKLENEFDHSIYLKRPREAYLQRNMYRYISLDNLATD